MSKVVLFSDYDFMMTVKIQLFESEKVCTCRAFCCWLSWVNRYTLMQSKRGHEDFNKWLKEIFLATAKHNTENEKTINLTETSKF